MQRQHIRLMIIIIIIMLVICFILVRADYKMHELDQQMPAIGCSPDVMYQIKTTYYENCI